METLKLNLCLLVILILRCQGSHFRGGTISWKPIGKQNKVEFKFKMAWSYGRGPGCTENKIGHYVNNNFVGDKLWKYVYGISKPDVDSLQNQTIGSVYYYCTDANKEGNWEQGENTFVYTFSGKGPFVISYTGAMWMRLSVQYSDYNGRWNLQTVVNLEERSDTGLPNASPLTASKALYILQFDCEHELQIPMVDPDGDTIKCRWAEGKECDSICHCLPNALLKEETCTLTFNADIVHFEDNGWYALALTVEDFPKSPITIGNSFYNTTTPMTAVPVQFLVHTIRKPLGCNQKPAFVEPTPAKGSHISVQAGTSIRTKIYSSNSLNPTANVTNISITCPPGMTHTGPVFDSSRAGVVYWELQWTPTQSQKGDNIFCAIVEDDSGQMSDSYCFSYIAWDIDPCASMPCNNGTCNRKGSTANYECLCLGFTGSFCETEIDECASIPCLNGGSCRDEINGYSCICPPEFTGRECQTDSYVGLSAGVIIGICLAVIAAFAVCFAVVFRRIKSKNKKVGIEKC